MSLIPFLAIGWSSKEGLSPLCHHGVFNSHCCHFNLGVIHLMLLTSALLLFYPLLRASFLFLDTKETHLNRDFWPLQGLKTLWV